MAVVEPLRTRQLCTASKLNQHPLSPGRRFNPRVYGLQNDSHEFCSGVAQIGRYAALLGSVISAVIQPSVSDVISRLDLQTEAGRADECRAAANEPRC